MECINCRYYKKLDEFNNHICDITHVINTMSCPLPDDNLVPDADICYNCKYWIGGGDWGLSCFKDYYNTSTNGFNKICEQFERN